MKEVLFICSAILFIASSASYMLFRSTNKEFEDRKKLDSSFESSLAFIAGYILPILPIMKTLEVNFFIALIITLLSLYVIGPFIGNLFSSFFNLNDWKKEVKTFLFMGVVSLFLGLLF